MSMKGSPSSLLDFDGDGDETKDFTVAGVTMLLVSRFLGVVDTEAYFGPATMIFYLLRFESYSSFSILAILAVWINLCFSWMISSRLFF